MCIDPSSFGFTAELLKQATRNTRRRAIPVARVARNESGTLYCIQVCRDADYSILRSRKRQNPGKSEGSAQTSPPVHEFVSITIAHTSASDIESRSKPDERQEEDKNDGQGVRQLPDG